MKHQIASFLGELAEELGWEPELDDEIRVKSESAGPAYQNASRAQGAPSPASRLARDLRQLRDKLDHLSSEVTELRAQLARIRGVPAPPDALPQPPVDWPDPVSSPAPLGLASPTSATAASSPAELSQLPVSVTTPTTAPPAPTPASSPAPAADVAFDETRPWPPALFSTAIPAVDPDPLGSTTDTGQTADPTSPDTPSEIGTSVTAAEDMSSSDPAASASLTGDGDASAAPSLDDEVDSALKLFPAEPPSGARSKRRTRRSKKTTS